MEKLPIESIKQSLFDFIDEGIKRFVVCAPTASGKSTRLCKFLSDKIQGQIFVLQPRRVAARMLAKAVAEIFDIDVGWHVRFDKHYTKNSKIVFITEGILLNMLMADPSLKGVGAVIFDEFHERNIYADISLALVLRTQENLRKDLCILVCSASMDSGAVSEYMGKSSRTLSCSSRLYDVDVEYMNPTRPVWEMARLAFEKFDIDGNVLIFMAGIYEINKTITELSKSAKARGYDIFALHSSLSPSVQDKIVSPSQRKKIIVSTNIAETSLTIEGIVCVIDSGLAKVARYDVARGLNTLLVEQISLANAIQRSGRAGRLQKGLAVRLWRKNDEQYFPKFVASEISRLDLSQIILYLKARNIDIAELKLFEKAPEKSIDRSVKTLKSLGALDDDFNITQIGKDMALLTIQVRYARLLLEAMKCSCLEDACILAGISEVGKIKVKIENPYDVLQAQEFVGDVDSQIDELIKICKLEGVAQKSFCKRYGFHFANIKQAMLLAQDFYRICTSRLKIAGDDAQEAPLSRAILCAFSDHIGVRLNKGTLACRFLNGAKGEIVKPAKDTISDLFVAMSLQERHISKSVNIVADLTVPIKVEDLKSLYPEKIKSKTSTYFDTQQRKVVCENGLYFEDMLLSQDSDCIATAQDCAKLMTDEILKGNLPLKNFNQDCQDFVDRLNFVATNYPEAELVSIDENAKREIFEDMCYGINSYSQLKNVDILKHLKSWLSYEQNSLLDYLAPISIQVVPNRKPVKIKYTADRAIISASFKDLFPFNPENVKICNSKVKPVFEILAPNGRPIQSTTDLKNFWQNSWQNIRKEVKARYPKHFKNTDAW